MSKLKFYAKFDELFEEDKYDSCIINLKTLKSIFVDKLNDMYDEDGLDEFLMILCMFSQDILMTIYDKMNIVYPWIKDFNS